MLGRRLCCASRVPRYQTNPVATPRAPFRTFAAVVSSLPLSLSCSIKSGVAPASLFIIPSSPSFRVSSSSFPNMSLRRSKSSKSGNGETNGHAPPTNGSAAAHHDEHEHSDSDAHSHSHSIFSSHSHGEEGHLQAHEKIMEALRGGGK